MDFPGGGDGLEGAREAGRRRLGSRVGGSTMVDVGDKPFVGVIELLRTIYGSEQVRTGGPVPPDVLDGIERALGVSLPADYREFVATWGYLCAGPLGNTAIYGVVPAGAELEYELDLRRMTPLLAAEVAERVEDDDELREAMEEAGAVVPVIGWAEDVPHHTVHVFDARGALRWFLVKENALDPPGGVRFTEFLQARVMRLFEQHMADVATAAAQGAASDSLEESDYRRLVPIGPVVAHAIEQLPAAVEEILLYETTVELRKAIEDRAAEGAADGVPAGWARDWARSMREFMAAPGVAELDQLIGPEATVAERAPALVFILTGREEAAALAEGSPIARAFAGERDLPAVDHRTSLVAADAVASIAEALTGAAEQVRERYDAAALRARGLFDESETEDSYLEVLVDTAREAALAFRAAADEGGAILVRHSPI